MKGDVHAGNASLPHLMSLPFSHRSLLLTPKRVFPLIPPNLSFPTKWELSDVPMHLMGYCENKIREETSIYPELWVKHCPLVQYRWRGHVSAVLGSVHSASNLFHLHLLITPDHWFDLIFHWELPGSIVLTHAFANEGVCEGNRKNADALTTVYWHPGNSQMLLQSQ